MFSSRKKSKQNPSQPSRKPAQEEESLNPRTSFLFSVAELHVNEDINDGGLAPRMSDDGRWIPPIYRQGFRRRARPRQLYRWREGVITDYGQGRIHDGAFRVEGTGTNLQEYCASSTFWCNRFVRFLTTNGDATRRDIADDEEPNNRWWPLNFFHDGSISRIIDVGEQYLTGAGPAWIGDLGLDAYRNSDSNAPVAGGLSGHLAILIGIIAFTCSDNQLYQVLVGNRAWHHNEWRGGPSRGRVEGRGLLVTIYYDPTNPLGSNENTLQYLAWQREEPLIHQPPQS